MKTAMNFREWKKAIQNDGTFQSADTTNQATRVVLNAFFARHHGELDESGFQAALRWGYRIDHSAAFHEEYRSKQRYGMPAPTLTDGEHELLQTMRAHCDGATSEDATGSVWAAIYLDNTPLRVENPRRFAGLCGSLEKKGFYQPMDSAFGDVRLND